MTSDQLENLVAIGQLKPEPPRAGELAGLKRSGLSRLADAERAELAFDSRFDLAYNAAHALALYALRRKGYRAKNRYLAFQTLPIPRACLPDTGGSWPRPTKGETWPSTRAIWNRTSGSWPT